MRLEGLVSPAFLTYALGLMFILTLRPRCNNVGRIGIMSAVAMIHTLVVVARLLVIADLGVAYAAPLFSY